MAPPHTPERNKNDKKGRDSMRAVVTRVASASVTIDGTVEGAIEKGYLILQIGRAHV